jgi:hypothetical protein
MRGTSDRPCFIPFRALKRHGRASSQQGISICIYVALLSSNLIQPRIPIQRHQVNMSDYNETAANDAGYAVGAVDGQYSVIYPQ